MVPEIYLPVEDECGDVLVMRKSGRCRWWQGSEGPPRVTRGRAFGAPLSSSSTAPRVASMGRTLSTGAGPGRVRSPR